MVIFSGALVGSPRNAAALDLQLGPGDNQQTAVAQSTAAAGAHLAWTRPARTDTHRVLLGVHGGYMSRFRWARSGAAEVVLLRPGSASSAPATGSDVGLAIRAAASSRGSDEPERGELGVRAQLTFERDAGVDLSAGVSYQTEGFNLRPAVVPALALSTHLGSLLAVANLLYGHGLADEERFGAARLALLHPVGERLHLGIDSSLELDLELDEDEPDGEPQLVAQGGPAITYASGNIAVSAQGGASVVQLRFGQPRAGGVAFVGVGGAF